MLISMVTFCYRLGRWGEALVWAASDCLNHVATCVVSFDGFDLWFGLTDQTVNITTSLQLCFVFFTLSFCVHHNHDNMIHSAATVTECIMSVVTINTLYMYICQHLMTLTMLLLHCLFHALGDCGSTVVKVLCYKSEGCWFNNRWCHWNFSMT